MIQTTQLQRLKEDEKELGYYIKRLKKRGKDNIAENVEERLAFLRKTITSVENRLRG